jgi:hypothetical protein
LPLDVVKWFKVGSPPVINNSCHGNARWSPGAAGDQQRPGDDFLERSD